jgi:putative acetyltransferase
LPLIRSEQPRDVAAIQAVHSAAFPTVLEAQLVDALRAAGRLTVSLVAEEGGRIVGHVAFSPVTIAAAADGLGLGPVAVLPEFQRRGIGGGLITCGLAAAERLGTGFVVVLGEPAYYGRFGFRPAAEWELRDEYGGGPAFQAMELRPGALAHISGLVCYAPEFALVGGE